MIIQSPELLKGKVAIVTGAGAGIGRASASAIARAGARVMVSDISLTSAQETVDLIRSMGGIAEAYCGDVSSSPFGEDLVSATLSAFGRLDLAHNNAGIESPNLPITETDEDAFDRVIAVNLKGIWLTMRAQLRHMAQQRSGAIVNTASVGGLVAVPGNAGYCAAKHGVIGLSKTAAIEFASSGIRVNAICPGLTRSGMTDRLFGENPAAMDQLVPPMGRMAEASEIAESVVFLLSGMASYMSGQAMAVDGAATAI